MKECAGHGNRTCELPKVRLDALPTALTRQALSEEHTDQGLHYALFSLHLLSIILLCKANLFAFYGDYSIMFSVERLRTLRYMCFI